MIQKSPRYFVRQHTLNLGNPITQAHSTTSAPARSSIASKKQQCLDIEPKKIVTTCKVTIIKLEANNKKMA